MLGDCHIHMVLDGVDYRRALGAHREAVQDGWIRACLKEYAHKGITFLRDGGDALGVARRAAELASEYGIDYRTPLFPICREGRYGAFIGRTFSDFAEYRLLVDEVFAGGGDFVKIMISGLMDFDRFGVITSEPLTREEIRDMIAYAHDRGLAVMAHANGAETILHALEAGVDSIEHGAYMNAQCVSAMAQSRAIWVPTLVTIGNLMGCGRHPDEVLRPLLALQMENVRTCALQGGSIAVGSDAGAYRVMHGQGLDDEVALLMQVVSGEVLEAGEKRIRERFRRR